jgi:hypothetical protein
LNWGRASEARIASLPQETAGVGSTGDAAPRPQNRLAPAKAHGYDARDSVIARRNFR